MQVAHTELLIFVQNHLTFWGCGIMFEKNQDILLHPKGATTMPTGIKVLVCDDDAAFAGQLAEKIEAIVKPQMPRSTVDCATDAAQLRALPLANMIWLFGY